MEYTFEKPGFKTRPNEYSHNNEDRLPKDTVSSFDLEKSG